MLLNSNPIHPLTNKLLDWYTLSKRDLPWRSDPQPYNIWLSEIVFQQTRIEQGLSYYERLIENFPSVKVLAEADEREVLKSWEGLGYYSRARNLHYSAKLIMDEHDGVFPREYKDILALKGVGPYTAAAISSIAFKHVIPAIDGNVLRVVSRLFMIEDPVDQASTRKIIEKELSLIIDKDNPGDFNQAMMELGALICKPQNPICNDCPISSHCIAFERNKQSAVPIKKNKVKVSHLFFNYLVFHTDEHLLLDKRTSGIWKGLYQFPLVESDGKAEAVHIIEQMNLVESYNDLSIIESEEYKHILSHRIINAKFFIIRVQGFTSKKTFLEVAKEDLSNYPMPRLINRFLSSETGKQILM